MSDDIARGGGVSASTADLLLAVKLGPGLGLLRDILGRRAAADRARREGLVATDEEIADALSDFFSENDLFEEAQQEAWLGRSRLTRAALGAHFAEVLLTRKLRVHLAPDAAVEKRYQASLHQYARANVEIVELDSPGAAAETALQLREGEIAWTDATSRAGGVDALTLTRAEAPEEVAAELFSAPPGAFLGPLETDEGGHAIYRLISREDPELDDELREEIRERMFLEEISRAFEKQPIQLLV
ncbi:MAG TPA: peptidyl-prolyl cis-trans isomerase [Planctomycetota bacterium]